MVSKKTYFSEQWLDCPVSKIPGHKEQAFCKMCKKLLELGNMGKKALMTHSKTELHKDSGEASSSGCSLLSSTSRTTEAASTEAPHQDPVHVPIVDKLLVPYYSRIPL
ncbi:hypothetical protein PR048_023374 [Dryococelus australis]|uniref:BED-type domain-containing protein n=1 Tax=Dryococelus australis TaxID=614101 RepID=A0ABQ9GTW3_9NEOP|nr:hypothetical protein PR048_023374 [Dryococelus australis]